MITIVIVTLITMIMKAPRFPGTKRNLEPKAKRELEMILSYSFVIIVILTIIIIIIIINNIIDIITIITIIIIIIIITIITEPKAKWELEQDEL